MVQIEMVVMEGIHMMLWHSQLIQVYFQLNVIHAQEMSYKHALKMENKENVH